MSLSQVTAPTRTIMFGEIALVVHAFGINQIAGIVTKQRDGLEPVFDAIEAAGVKNVEDILTTNLGNIGGMLLNKFPEFVSDAIAVALGEPDQADKVANLPAPVQIKILKAAMELTFVDEAELREFLGNVLRAVTAASRVMSLQTPVSPQSFASPSGSMDAEQQLHS